MIVYVREAHPEMLKTGNKTGIIGRPKDFAERTILATECLLKYKFTIPTIIDYMDGRVNKEYAAAPVRTTITDLDGNVVYYAGPGPFDFKIPKIEKAINRVIAGGGYMPAVPQVQWGQAVDGLRCGLSIDPADPAVGDDVTVRMGFENVGNVECDVYYGGGVALKNIALRGSKGGKLVIEPVVDNSRWAKRFRGREIGWKKIAAGGSREFVAEGKIVGGEGEKVAAGEYGAELSWKVDQGVLAGIEGEKPSAVWLGEVKSGKCELDVSLERKEGCMDCHSKDNYHHKSNKDCTLCHSGKAETEDFKVKKDACVCCHKREEKFGRRKVFGANGDFDLKSKHISGMITDDKCRECHDLGKHGDGKVLLVGGDESRAAFCLRCHEGKSTFLKSKHGKKLDCSACHESHGSVNRVLLKGAFSANGGEEVGELYALCWKCHKQEKTLRKKQHKKGVLTEKKPCGECHDVHNLK